MTEVGIVKSVDGNMCTVLVRRKTACGEDCATCSAVCEAREQQCIAGNDRGAAVGDRVLIEMDSKKVLKSAFLVYILPVLVFLTVFVILKENGKDEISSGIFAVLGAAVVFVSDMMYSKRKKEDFIPQVKEIL